MKKKIGIFTIIWFLLMGLAGCGSEKKAENTVTVSIRCDTAVEKGLCEEEKWKGVLPEDGCIFPETEIVTANGETVFDVLCRREGQRLYRGHRESLRTGWRPLERLDVQCQRDLSRCDLQRI